MKLKRYRLRAALASDESEKKKEKENRPVVVDKEAKVSRCLSGGLEWACKGFRDAHPLILRLEDAAV